MSDEHLYMTPCLSSIPEELRMITELSMDLRSLDAVVYNAMIHMITAKRFIHSTQ